MNRRARFTIGTTHGRLRFEFTRGGRRVRIWQLIEGREVELCRFDPGFGEDLIVRIEDPLTFAHWHMGLVDWAAARCR